MSNDKKKTVYEKLIDTTKVINVALKDNGLTNDQRFILYFVEGLRAHMGWPDDAELWSLGTLVSKPDASRVFKASEGGQMINAELEIKLDRSEKTAKKVQIRTSKTDRKVNRRGLIFGVLNDFINLDDSGSYDAFYEKASRVIEKIITDDAWSR